MNWDTPCHVSGQPGAMEHERCLDIFHDSGLENVVIPSGPCSGTRYVRSSTSTSRQEPSRRACVSTRLRRMGRRRDRAIKRARIHCHDPRVRALARQLKHDHQRAMRKAYCDFIDNLISIDNEDHLLTDKRPPKQKRLFQYIKSLRKECSGVPSLKQGDRLITDTIGKAEALNDQYQLVFTKEPPGPIRDKGSSPYQTMEDPFITEAGVLKLLQNIKVDKATGPDVIAARVMRETAVDLAPVLTTIFTHSINTESVPDDCRRQMSSRYSRKAQSTITPTTDPSLSPVSPAK